MEKLYFIRVGGSAMGPVAAALASQGLEVSGSEESLYEPMKSTLAKSGVRVMPTFDPANLAEANPDLVVVGNAVSRGNSELEEALNLRLPLASLPQLVAERMIGRAKSLVVAGTHGKTTTTSMLATILEASGLHPGWLIGGVPGNLESGCRPLGEEARKSGEGIFVIEGDEYDTAFFDKRSKFLWYRPWGAAVTGIEFDHSDIFDSLEQIQRSFRLLLRLIPSQGLLAVKEGDPGLAPLLEEAKCRVETYGIGSGDWRVESLADGPEGLAFELVKEGQVRAEVRLEANGVHNALNFAAAAALASFAGARREGLEAGARLFRLPKRRMEPLGSCQGALVIDDFAHHPTAVKATLGAARAKWPQARLWVVFEPRTNTMTRAFYQKEIREALEEAEGVFLGPLDRPWRFQEAEKLDTGRLCRELTEAGKAAEWTPEEESGGPWGSRALAWLSERAREGDVILLLSNGDLGGLRGLLQGR